MYNPLGPGMDTRSFGAGTSDINLYHWYLTPQVTEINTGRYYVLSIPEWEPGITWARPLDVREFEVAISVRDMRDGATAGLCLGDGVAIVGQPSRASNIGEMCGFWFETDGVGANRPVSVWTETRDGVLSTATDVDTFADDERHVCRIEMDMPNSEVRYYIDSVLVNTDAPYAWTGAGAVYGRLSLMTTVAVTSSFTFFQVWYHSDYI